MRANFFVRQRMFKLMIGNALHRFMLDDRLGFFSIQKMENNERGNSFKIFLLFAEDERKKNEKLIELLNKKYIFKIKKILIDSQKFAFIPWIKFFFVWLKIFSF